MSDFSKAIPFILKHEGLYSDNPKDPGGPTNYGISLSFLKGLGCAGDLNHDGVVDVRDIKGITVADAMKLYYDNFWAKYKYENVIAQPIATKLFDLCVNMGPTAAHKVAQLSVNRLVVEREKLTADGILGPKSFAAINGIKPNTLMNILCNEAEKYYDSLVIKKPDLETFLRGWHNRADARCGL